MWSQVVGWNWLCSATFRYYTFGLRLGPSGIVLRTTTPDCNRIRCEPIPDKCCLVGIIRCTVTVTLAFLKENALGHNIDCKRERAFISWVPQLIALTSCVEWLTSLGLLTVDSRLHIITNPCALRTRAYHRCLRLSNFRPPSFATSSPA